MLSSVIMRKLTTKVKEIVLFPRAIMHLQKLVTYII